MMQQELEARTGALEASIKALQTKIDMLEDIEEIKKLMATYTYSLDYGELGKLLDCFADDAQMEVGVRDGREAPFVGKYSDKKAIESLYGGIMEQFPDPSERFVVAHLIQNEVVEVEGNKASGTFYLLEAGAPPPEGGQVSWIQGRYDNQFVKVDGRWKISFFGFTFNLLPG
jgi:hypothetical protein